MNYCRILLSVVLLLFITNISAQVVIRIAPPSENDISHHYFSRLLELALDKTRDTHGSYQLVYAPLHMVQSRAQYEIERGRLLDIMWTMTSAEREEKLLPIRIPLFKGLLGFRVFLIHEADQEKFASIQTINELKSLTAGQGIDWPDTSILLSNGFKVVGVSNYSSLFKMLKRRRIDYFPRGINEAWQEVAMTENRGIIVESNILLHYFSPIYFFVGHHNTQLAQRIERGLRIAIDDGSFDQIFFNASGVNEALNNAHIHNRLLIQLDNPSLHPLTPIDEEKLWFSFPLSKQLTKLPLSK